MSKDNVFDWDTTAGNNTDIGGIDIAEGCEAANINNAIREMMAQQASAITRRTTQATNYTAVAADYNQLIEFTASATLSLTAAATLGDGWSCVVKANGGAVTIDPNGAETIGGATTWVIQDGGFASIYCDGSAFHVTGTNLKMSATGQSLSALGSAAAPSLSFNGDTDTGFYRDTPDVIGLATGGVQRVLFGLAALVSSLQHRLADGDASAPSYSFSSDTDTGMYLVNGIAFSYGGNLVFRIQADGDIEAPGVYSKTTGSAASVFVDSNGVLYRSTSSLKYKENFQPISDEQVAAWLSVDGFSYTQKGEETGRRYFGFAAEAVKEAGLPELVTVDENGEPEGYEYGRDMALAKKVIKDLITRVDKLEKLLPLG